MATKNILGIDVGTSAIKVLVAATIDGQTRVCGSGTAATVGFAKGVMTDAAALASSIKQAVDCATMAAAIPLGTAFIGLGGMDITGQNSLGSITLASPGAITAGDIERACRAATIVAVPNDHRIIHVLPTSYWLDGSPVADAPLGRPGARLEVEAHIVSLPRLVADELIAALAAQGITVAGLVANTIAGATGLAGDLPSYLFIDIGAGLADLTLTSGGHVVMSASVPLGGDYITADIMHGFEISWQHAEEIKRYYAKLDSGLLGRDVMLDCNDYGTTDKQIPYDFLHKIVESRAEEIVSLLHAYLEPALSRYGAERILLTGGSSLLPSIGGWTEKMFALSVKMVRPGAKLSAEYAQPSNAACFGIIEYAAKLTSVDPTASGGFRSFFRKLKDII